MATRTPRPRPSRAPKPAAPPAAESYAEAFPRSTKVHVEGTRGIRVPMREIALSGGEPPLRVYDPSGPQGFEISEILRHEIGHALGLGHSRNRSTIMYPENTQLDLTDLDKETLHLLYMLPPGKVK